MSGLSTCRRQTPHALAVLSASGSHLGSCTGGASNVKRQEFSRKEEIRSQMSWTSEQSCSNRSDCIPVSLDESAMRCPTLYTSVMLRM
uniref:Putative secreted protein n=1 Tax=Ixodes ricinus TaxID=34613 RepID=A0A6B0U5T7_IXORI